MYTKTIKYIDYNDQEKTATLRFHLSKPEVLSWAMQNGETSFDRTIIRIMEKQNTKDMMDAFEDLICRSYGERTDDGRFEKGDDIYRKFKSSAAYPEFFMTIATDAEEGVAFLKGIMPKDIAEEFDKAMRADGLNSLPSNIKAMLPKE